jgi:ankyrin repeat protein
MDKIDELCNAVEQDDFESVKNLLKFDDVVDFVRQSTDIVSRAVMDSGKEILDILLEHGANVASLSTEGFTALHLATRFAGYPTMKILLEHGAIVDSVDSEGMTPLFYAVEISSAETIIFLLDNGANINHVADNDFTVLDLCYIAGDIYIANILIERGANIVKSWFYNNEHDSKKWFESLDY